MTPRILGLDVGDVRIGVALSDPLGITAQGLTVLARAGLQQDVAEVGKLAQQHAVATIVIGLPLTLRGERGPQAQKVLAFSAALTQALAIPVELVDERLTTAQGARALREAGTSSRKQKGMIDQVAAQLILQQFLDTTRPRPHDQA
jgi:putative Holliday junction resolvase